jgi:hypothetical protein
VAKGWDVRCRVTLDSNNHFSKQTPLYPQESYAHEHLTNLTQDSCLTPTNKSSTFLFQFSVDMMEIIATRLHYFCACLDHCKCTWGLKGRLHPLFLWQQWPYARTWWRVVSTSLVCSWVPQNSISCCWVIVLLCRAFLEHKRVLPRGWKEYYKF